uniref:Uncharacterized protein LOC102810057 n=1 Tax=Saccoglossus kowalevskii TaxID=10224 RepID=A0ABM0M9D6_SACKO
MGTSMSSTQDNKQSHLLRATERESLNCQLIQLFSLFKFGLPPRYICTAYSRMFKTGLNLKRYGLGNQETFANNLDDTIFEKTRYRKTSKVIWVKLKDTYRLSRIPGENDKDIENLREELIILFRRHPKGITWNKIDKLYTKVFQNQENVLELQRNATTGVITQEQLLFCRQSNNEFDVSGEFAVTRCWTNIQKGYAMQHKRQTIKDQSRTTGQSSNTGKATKSRTNCAEKPPDKYNGITSKRKNKEEKMSRNRQ